MFKRPLSLVVFMHEDLSDYNKDALYDKHFSWLADEMENISGRPMAIVLVRPSDAEDLSSHDYQDNDANRSLRVWKQRINHYLRTESKIDFDDKLNKFLLLTRAPINRDVLGIANLPGYVAIASIIETRTAAHEVGHMFNATHQDGEIIYNGWWSETTMKETDGLSEFRHDADRFSDKNRENIRKYLENA